MNRKITSSIFPLLGYTILTIFMTFPTISHITTAIPGDGFDGWQNYWNLWWIRQALLNHQTHFFYTDLLYSPTGTSLLFHTLNYFNGLTTLPIQLNFGLAVTYNLVVFFHFIMAGFGVYLLARYVICCVIGPHHFKGEGSLAFTPSHSKGRVVVGFPAFIAGIIFTFSPFHMAHLLGHMQVLSLTWVPFYVLWLVRTLNHWRLAKTTSFGFLPIKDLILMGIFLIFTTMVDWYQTLYLLLFTPIVIVWAIATRPDRFLKTSQVLPLSNVSEKLIKPFKSSVQLIISMAFMGLVVGMLFSPLIIPMAQEAHHANYMRPSFEENIILSADLLAFITPSELHPWWGNYFRPIYDTFTTTTSERLVFIGIIPLLLAIFAGVRYRKNKMILLWAIITPIFMILALGPYLHVAGDMVNINGTLMPMPYLLLYKIVPFIGITRSLSRYSLIVMIGVSVLAGVTLYRFKLRYQLLAFILICLEFVTIPYPISMIDTPEFFTMIGQDKQDYTIAALPMNWDRPNTLLYQTVHSKKLLTAYTSRNNPLDLTWRTPVLQQWRTLQDDIIKTDLAKIAPTVLHDFNVRYIVLDYYQMPVGDERHDTEKWVSIALPNLDPIYNDGRLTVYESPKMHERQAYLQFGEGWGRLESISEIPSRMISNEATLSIIADESNQYQLIITSPESDDWHDMTIFHGDIPLELAFMADNNSVIISLPAKIEMIRLITGHPLHISQLTLIDIK